MATADRNRSTIPVAFALGGLAGNNFHGLGFLQAALDLNVKPGMISCTSGQIYMVWKYLLARRGELKQRHGVANLAEFAAIFQDVLEFKPSAALPHVLGDIPDMMATSVKHLMDLASFQRSKLGYLMDATLNAVPAHILEPHVDKQVLRDMCACFHKSDVGIAFNSYDPVDGVETVYLNHTAQELLHREAPLESSFRKSPAHVTQYRPITAAGIVNALWIYEYGFERHISVDGAYFRMAMLAELSRAERIFVCRPVQGRWKGALPVTYGEKEDLKTEVFFNAAYLGERFRIELVNRLLDDKVLKPAEIKKHGYHHVEITEVEPPMPQPFVSYFSEDMETFDGAYEAARAALQEYQQSLTSNGKARAGTRTARRHTSTPAPRKRRPVAAGAKK